MLRNAIEVHPLITQSVKLKCKFSPPGLLVPALRRLHCVRSALRRCRRRVVAVSPSFFGTACRRFVVTPPPQLISSRTECQNVVRARKRFKVPDLAPGSSIQNGRGLRVQAISHKTSPFIAVVVGGVDDAPHFTTVGSSLSHRRRAVLNLGRSPLRNTATGLCDEADPARREQKTL